MKVCIAEKPSVGKEIAQIVGAKTKRDGYFEGNGYCVTWTFGHFCSLYEPEDYRGDWKRWSLDSLPMLPQRFETKVINDEGVKRQFEVIKSLFEKAEVVINCGDAGQEGELIQRWVIKQAGYTGKVQRLWISSLTPEAIREGFEKLTDASDYDNLYYAGSSRAIGDWLLGMNATRLFTLRFGAQKQVLSIGRVQTPTLAMLVERFLEIENFKPKPYWELQTLYRETQFNSAQGRFEKKEDGEKLLEQVTGKPLTITNVTKKKGKESPPSLFDLTSLQVYCNNKFGFSADYTLKTLQRLYEMKVVTYPRVDTTYLPNDQYAKIPGILDKLKQYSVFTEPLKGKPIRKSKKVFNNTKVTDHHAIIPTGVEIGLGADEQKLFDAVARRFIAAFYPDCTVAKTAVEAEVDGIKFTTTGKEILDPGWRVLYPTQKKSNTTEDKDKKDEEKTLPTFEKGEQGDHEPSFLEKETKPPKQYTEATLLRAMETAGKQVEDDELRALMKANGIGRPSTRAAIIETLFKRQYIKRNKKQILPTEMGIQLVEIIQNQLLKSAELTGMWEKQLKEIEDGNFSPVHFIDNMKKMVDHLVYEVRSDTTSLTMASLQARMAEKEKAKKAQEKAQKAQAKSLQGKCPKCKEGDVLKGKSAYGCSNWKNGCDFRLPFSFMGKKISEKQYQRLLDKGATVKLKGFKDGDNKLDGIVQFNDNFELTLNSSSTESTSKKTEEKPTQSDTIPCPKCKEGQVMKGKTAYGCSNWQNGCDFRFAFSEIFEKAGGRELTKELVLDIISGKI